MWKLVGSRLDSLEIGFFRCAFGLATVLPFMLRGGTAAFRTERPMLHLFRGLLGTTAMFCSFYALTHLPLADATAIGFANTLFMIVLARSEEHTSELQSLMRISYAVFCLKKKNK